MEMDSVNNKVSLILLLLLALFILPLLLLLTLLLLLQLLLYYSYVGVILRSRAFVDSNFRQLLQQGRKKTEELPAVRTAPHSIIIIPSLPLFTLLTLPSLLFCPSTCLLWVKMLSNEFFLSASVNGCPPIKEPPLSFMMVLFSPPTLVGLLRLSCF